MPEPGKLEKMLINSPLEVNCPELKVSGMLRVTRAVIDVLKRYYKETEGENSEAGLVLGEAYGEIPEDLDDVRQIDSEEGVC